MFHAYLAKNRQTIRNIKGIKPIVELLSSSVPEVQAKAAMAIEMMVEDNGEPHILFNNIEFNAHTCSIS